LRNNYDLRIAAAGMEEARSNIGIVRSFLYPQINFNERSRWAEEAAGQVMFLPTAAPVCFIAAPSPP
jgi:hypothetical protein